MNTHISGIGIKVQMSKTPKYRMRVKAHERQYPREETAEIRTGHGDRNRSFATTSTPIAGAYSVAATSVRFFCTNRLSLPGKACRIPGAKTRYKLFRSFRPALWANRISVRPYEKFELFPASFAFVFKYRHVKNIIGPYWKFIESMTSFFYRIDNNYHKS